MRCLFAILFSFLLTTSVEAEMCGLSNTLIERDFVWDFQEGFLESVPLPQVYGGTEYPSHVNLTLSATDPTRLFGTYAWTTNDLGFEYNLYRLQIQIGDGEDAQLIDQDYTNGCRNPPQGLDHGKHLDLVPIALRPHNDGSPLGLERVHLRFWGK
jgi:hypothetical protein